MSGFCLSNMHDAFTHGSTVSHHKCASRPLRTVSEALWRFKSLRDDTCGDHNLWRTLAPLIHATPDWVSSGY